jgi:hypothetical protein
MIRGNLNWVAVGLACCLVPAGAGADEPAPSGASDRPPPAAASADAVLDRWVEAQGGAFALTNLDALETEDQIDVEPAGVHLTERLLRLATGRFRWEVTAPSDAAIVAASDGQTTWAQSPRLGFGLLPSAMVPSGLRPDDVWTAYRMGRIYPTRTLLGDAVVAGQACQELGLSDGFGTYSRWAFDKRTGQLVRIEWPLQRSIAAAVAIEFSDFRPVGALVLPFLTRQTSGSFVRVIHRLRATTDPAFEPGAFTAPADLKRAAGVVTGILGRFLSEAGGGPAISAIHTRVTHMTLNQVSAGGKSEITVWQKLPFFILSEQETEGMGRTMQGYDGQTGWENSDLLGFRVLKGAELSQLLGQANLRQNLELAAGCPLRRYLGVRDVKGRPADVVALATLQASAGVYYFDRQDSSLLRVENAIVGEGKTSIPVTVDFSDFRVVDGVKIPFLVTTTNPGMQLVTVVRSVANNVPLDDAMFQPQRGDLPETAGK